MEKVLTEKQRGFNSTSRLNGYTTIEKSRDLCHEIVNKVRVEKTVFDDMSQKNGYMTVEEMGYLLHDMVKEVYADDTI